jgi:mono/diheme cytochrome c family protein
MRLLIATFALACLGAPAGAQTATPSNAAPSAAPGAAEAKPLYDAHCRKCHGPAGQPSAAMKRLLPDLPSWSPAFFATRSDADIVTVLKNGKGKNMQPFGDRVSEAQMKALAAYIRTIVP